MLSDLIGRARDENDGQTITVGAGFRDRWRQAKQAWQIAIEEIDGQMAKLQGVLKNSEDEELQAIAEFGFNATTGNFKVPLMAAMRDIDAAEESALMNSIAKAQPIIVKFQQHIASDQRVEACDNNPFGVRVTIRQSLGSALTSLNATLSAKPQFSK